MKYKTTKVLEEIYDEKHDITILMESKYDNDNALTREEIVGWYHGKPNTTETKNSYNSLIKEYVDIDLDF